MHPFYEKRHQTIDIFRIKNRHYPPHLHPFLECVYIQKGSLAIGQGNELYQMETGDFALIFPNTIHHYQVFSEEESKGSYLMASSEETGIFQKILTEFVPVNPVISSEKISLEIRHALQAMLNLKTEEPYAKELIHAYLQIILGKSLPLLELLEKTNASSNDIVMDVVSYMAAHYKEELTLNSTASDLGVSPYVLSRVFSGTFHTNFNTYINEMRLKYAGNLLKYSEMPITEVALESGFSSLRTFNRFCKEKLLMTPREYRNKYKNLLSTEQSKSV